MKTLVSNYTFKDESVTINVRVVNLFFIFVFIDEFN